MRRARTNLVLTLAIGAVFLIIVAVVPAVIAVAALP